METKVKQPIRNPKEILEEFNAEEEKFISNHKIVSSSIFANLSVKNISIKYNKNPNFEECEEVVRD